MPQGNTWEELLNNIEYKDQLIEMIKQYVLEFGIRKFSKSIPFIVTLREKDYFTSLAGNKVISVCIHEGLALHVSKVDSDVAVACKDTDTLNLMIWAYWAYFIDYQKIADLRKICFHLGKTLSLNLLKIHTLTGCDITAYSYWVAKIKVFKKLLGQQDLCFLLSELGN